MKTWTITVIERTAKVYTVEAESREDAWTAHTADESEQQEVIALDADVTIE